MLCTGPITEILPRPLRRRLENIFSSEKKPSVALFVLFQWEKASQLWWNNSNSSVCAICSSHVSSSFCREQNSRTAFVTTKRMATASKRWEKTLHWRSAGTTSWRLGLHCKARASLKDQEPHEESASLDCSRSPSTKSPAEVSLDLAGAHRPARPCTIHSHHRQRSAAPPPPGNNQT